MSETEWGYPRGKKRVLDSLSGDRRISPLSRPRERTALESIAGLPFLAEATSNVYSRIGCSWGDEVEPWFGSSSYSKIFIFIVLLLLLFDSMITDVTHHLIHPIYVQFQIGMCF